MVFQQFVYRAGEKDFHIDPNDVYFGTGEIKDAINGIRTPTLTIRPGEIQRWRMIHAGIAEAMVLRLPGVEFYEIAVDGLATGSIRPTPEIVLYPGYRRDILVKAPIDPGTYYMSTQIADSRDSLRKRTTLESDVLKLVITGEPCAMTLPTADELRQFAAFPNDRVPDDASLKNIRDIRLDNNSQGQFLVNDREFSPDFVAIRPVVGTAEQWNIKAENGFHPFHVHVNPFAVWIPDSPNPRWEWRDTLFVRDGETVPIRMWFETFSGKTVMHCHNLEHEDKGMMQAIEIIEEPALITSVPTRTTSLLVLHLGIPCEHCATQLRQLAQYIDEFAQLGISIQAFSDNLPDVSSLEAMKQQMGITFPMLLDANRDLFRRYGCVNSQGKLLHGVFLVDAEGDILWKSIGPEPEMDIEKILRIARQFTNTR